MNGDSQTILDAINSMRVDIGKIDTKIEERHVVNQKDVHVMFEKHRDFKKEVLLRIETLANKVVCSSIHEKVLGHEAALKWLFGIIAVVFTGLVFTIIKTV